MKKRDLIAPLLILLVLSACNSNKTDTSDIRTDSTSIAQGKEIFSQNCITCHDFRQDGIGPQLGGITERASAAWIKDFIRNPKQIIESGDERGQRLFAQYKTIRHRREIDLAKVVSSKTHAQPRIIAKLLERGNFAIE